MRTRQCWFTADLHFNHDKLVAKDEKTGESYRPFESVKEMNEKLLDNIYSKWKEGDKLYITGDVLFQPATSQELMSKLPPGSTLILGNHDDIKRQTRYYVEHFKDIVVWRTFPEQRFVLTHIPIRQECFRGMKYNIHGHMHKDKIKELKYINICVENTDYTPVSMEELISEMERRDKYE